MTETPMRGRLARAACKSRTCEGMACCEWPANRGRIRCPVRDGGYDDAVDAILAELERPSEGMVEAANELDITAEVDSVIQIAAIHGFPLKPYAPDNTPLMQWFVAMIRAAREGK